MVVSLFRPCIDLHDGKVKQIVGGSLSDSSPSTLKTNFVSSHPPTYYAELFRTHQLRGGHVIKLGPGNDDAARAVLAAWPQGFQIGGGITSDNCIEWIEAGADKVIVTSWLFPNAKFSMDRLLEISRKVTPQRLVLDLSCRRRGENTWVVAMNKWQTDTDMILSQDTFRLLAQYCSEFLVHAADVEGLCQGIDEDLVRCLGQWSTIPCTYAGGAKDISDIEVVNRLSEGKVHLTYGSALDIFGGKGVKFQELCDWNRSRAS